MLKIGITGQDGFVGRHLFNTLGLTPSQFETVAFNKNYFDEDWKLDSFVSKCDVIVHLAAVNRHIDPQVIYNTNIDLVKILIASLVRTQSPVHVFMASSTQEEQDNLYGKSKRDGRLLLENWAKSSNGYFTGLIIPNVFGPFGKPNYNSVVATFCHQLTHNETPTINLNGDIKLIFVGELIAEMIKLIVKKDGSKNTFKINIIHTHQCSVSKLLELLNKYKVDYQENGIIPLLNNSFEINLFNTYRGYLEISSYFPVKFKKNTDSRGSFVELIRLNTGGQISFSTTLPDVTRGNHFHTRKMERFAVIKGKALIQLRQIGTNDVVNFEIDGSEPGYVDMPIWFTHNIKNIGNEDLYTIFWINEFYNPNDSDTYFESV